MSAFGVEHGEFSKAQDQPRDARGRYAAAHAQGRRELEKNGPLTRDELDEQYDWYGPDYKSLWMLAEKDPKEWRKKRKEMEEDSGYWHGRQEHDLAEDIETALLTSDDIHAKHHGKNVSKAAGSPKLTHEKNQKRDLRHRKKFAQRYQPGEAQKVRTKHLMQVQYRINPTKEEKIKALKSDLKRNGQVEPVGVGISRSDPNRTYLFDGHHRVNAQHRLHRRYTVADVEDNEQHHTWNDKKHPMPGVWPDKKVSKGFKKLRPKLAAGLYDEGVKAHLTMNQKMRRHAVEARMLAGGQGQSIARRMKPEARKKFLNQPYEQKYSKPGSRREVLRQHKVGAQGMYDTLGRMNSKNRVLP